MPQQGDANTYILNTHLSNTHTLQKYTVQEGKLRQDVFDQRDLLMTHTQNTLQQDTHIKNTVELWEAITTHTSNASTHSKTVQVATDQAANLGFVSGYDADDTVEFIEVMGAHPVIPPRVNRKKQQGCDWCLYKERHLVECFIGKIKHFRRVFSRFDKLAGRFLSFIQLASTLIWLR